MCSETLLWHDVECIAVRMSEYKLIWSMLELLTFVWFVQIRDEPQTSSWVKVIVAHDGWCKKVTNTCSSIWVQNIRAMSHQLVYTLRIWIDRWSKYQQPKVVMIIQFFGWCTITTILAVASEYKTVRAMSHWLAYTLEICIDWWSKYQLLKVIMIIHTDGDGWYKSTSFIYVCSLTYRLWQSAKLYRNGRNFLSCL